MSTPWRKHPFATAGLAIMLASVVIVLATDMRPAYDAYGWLVWGRQTLHWSLDTAGAPSWKPLAYLFTLPYALAGRGQIWLWMATAVAAALAGAAFAGRVAYRLTAEESERHHARVAAAIFAALGVLGIDRYWHFILISNSDPMIVALCLAAIDCHLSRHCRLTFALLVLVALGRPEGYPFVLGYALWAWRALPSTRVLLAAGVAIVPALWYGIPALTAQTWNIASHLAEHAADAPHGNKITGVIGRLLGLYEWPMLLAVLAGLALAVAQRNRTVLVLAGGALIWILIEIGFALRTYPADARYMFEPAAVLIVIAATGIGWMLGSHEGSIGALRWAGPALAVILVAALVPVARSRARFVHGEISYGRKFARQVNRLHHLILSEGGAARIRSCGQPVSELQFQSTLAWEVGLNVGSVGWRPPASIRSGQPIVLFEPHGWGWTVRPVHLRVEDRTRCGTLTASTAFS